MATAEYEGGLYVVGGIDENAQSVDIVEEIVAQGTVGIDDAPESMKGYKLEQNNPNPFTASTTIKYSLPIAAATTLKIYNTLGTEISTLVDESKDAGNYEVVINANELKRGVYFYRLQSGKFIQTKKLILQ
jgi:hypothetical protein